ncbi:MAG: low-specificity L-threonine aldolase [Anaerolineaceae bacterium]
MIDLRSDTVTQPQPERREAMKLAVVGDDVFREDPTVNRLEAMAAELTGKEAGLFVASGTMGNLVAVLATCERGDEVIMGDLGHTFLFEGGGISALGGVFPHTLRNQVGGTIDLNEIKAAIRPNDIHQPRTKMIILENTHNRCGGVVLSSEYTDNVANIAHSHEIKLHIDGARIFNAATALNTSVKQLVANADSITFCLSKGLCAPVGSVLCGSKDFIERSRRIRKQLGGGMRQAGVLAAAGIVSLEVVSKRLGEDHQRASMLANGLQQIGGMNLNLGIPQTNMVFAELSADVKWDALQVSDALKQHSVLVGVVGKKQFRMVTHYWIDDLAIENTLGAFRKILI